MLGKTFQPCTNSTHNQGSQLLIKLLYYEPEAKKKYTQNWQPHRRWMNVKNATRVPSKMN